MKNCEQPVLKFIIHERPGLKNKNKMKRTYFLSTTIKKKTVHFSRVFHGFTRPQEGKQSYSLPSNDVSCFRVESRDGIATIPTKRAKQDGRVLL